MDNRGGGRRREANRLPTSPPARRAAITAATTVPQVRPFWTPTFRSRVTLVTLPETSCTPKRNRVVEGSSLITVAVTVRERCAPPVVRITFAPLTRRYVPDATAPVPTATSCSPTVIRLFTRSNEIVSRSDPPETRPTWTSRTLWKPPTTRASTRTVSRSPTENPPATVPSTWGRFVVCPDAPVAGPRARNATVPSAIARAAQLPLVATGASWSRGAVGATRRTFIRPPSSGPQPDRSGLYRRGHRGCAPLVRGVEGPPARPLLVTVRDPDAARALRAGTGHRRPTITLVTLSSPPFVLATPRYPLARRMRPTSRARSGLTSMRSHPPGLSQVPPSRAARSTRPSPSSLRSVNVWRGSNLRTSSGSSWISFTGTYGGWNVTTSTRPFRSPGRAPNRSPRTKVTFRCSRSAFRLATDTARADTSDPYTRAPRASFFTASATAPPPVATSTATGRRLRWSRRTAWIARNSVESRGTNTPGVAISSSPRNSAVPVISWTGSPVARRRIAASNRRTSRAGLLIPAIAAPAPKRCLWGEVTLVGPEVRGAKGGGRILSLPQAGLEVELDGEEYLLLRERDVQAVASQVAGTEREPGQYL